MVLAFVSNPGLFLFNFSKVLNFGKVFGHALSSGKTSMSKWVDGFINPS